jgi:hypothetical protein
VSLQTLPQKDNRRSLDLMDITLHMRVVAAVLLLTLAARGQNHPSSEPNALRSGQSSRDGNQNRSPQPLTQPSAPQTPSQNVLQQTPSQAGVPATPASSPSPETKESFSQLTLFLFASGLALFTALLGWSDQIRGIDNDTTELEQRFLKKTGIKKGDFLDIIKPKSADDQLFALTRAESAGRIEKEETIEVLRTFAMDLNRLWSQVERLSSWKYNLTIALTITLFVAGIASLFITPTRQVPLYVVSMRAERVVLILPMILIGLLLAIIIRNARREKELRFILQSMSDKVER